MLTNGINHVAIVTSDLERLADFYTEVLEAELVQVHPTPFGRIGIIRIGPGLALNVFEVQDNAHATALPDMGGRGHIDHFGVNAVDREAFDEIRRRAEYRADHVGEISDFGDVIGFPIVDPDGMHIEVNLVLDPSLRSGHPPRPYAEVPA